LASYLILAGAEVDLLRGRPNQASAALRSIEARGRPDDFQFQQQMRIVETELRLWDPAGDRPHTTADVETFLGSSVVTGIGDEDPPLTARLLWLGVRADADARAIAEIADQPSRLNVLIADGNDLRDRGEALLSGGVSDGESRQVRVFLALIAGELTRLTANPDPATWKSAAAAAVSDPYLHSYALWRWGSSLRLARRRRDAATTLREAYRVADETGIRLVADAVVSAGNALGVRVDGPATEQPVRRKLSMPFDLTAKEMEVMDLLVQGLTNRRIASARRLTEKTASVHVSHILTKLSVGSRGEAVARAYEVGLARPPVSTGD
jgi:DNA-binding NarL/FixJ family response regulator